MEQEPQHVTGTFLLLLKLTIFTLLVPCTVTLWLPLWLYPSVVRWGAIEVSVATLAATALMLLGAIVYFWCALDFALVGRGVPAPVNAPKVLVVRGLYGYVRNPMYLGVLLVLVGESLLFHSWRLLGYAGFWFAIVFLFVLLFEEPSLRAKFGPSYEQYSKEVPRWIPRLHRGS